MNKIINPQKNLYEESSRPYALILPGAFQEDVVRMFERNGFDTTSPFKISGSNIHKGFSCVVFTGGADLNPRMYGESPQGATGWSDLRDAQDMAIFQRCLELNIPIIGICRGFQFIAAMQGQKLIQDCGNNSGVRPIFEKGIIGGKNMMFLHHQGVPINTKNMEMIFSHKTTDGSTVASMGYWKNIEAFGVQGHPEICSETEVLFFEYLFKSFSKKKWKK